MTTELGLFPEPERTPARSDGTWLVGPGPQRWRFLLLGEDGETLMVHGHDVTGDDVRELLFHAGCSWDGIDGAVLPMRRTWAAELTSCPTHRRWQRWVIRPAEWVRYQLFRLLWRLWWSRDPLRQWWRPRLLTWVQHRWHGFAQCGYCQWTAGTDDPWWTWDTHGGPVDANRDKPGYLPVTVVDLT